MKIKICGVCTHDHARAAVDAGADMIGLVFAPSRRQIDVADAASIADAARAAALDRGRAVLLIGVFVNETVERIRDIVQSCGLDGVQLSGDEPVSYADALAPLLVIKAIRFDDSAEERAWLVHDWPHVRLLVDARVPGSYGGTGIIADWDRAAELARWRPVLLAGGLTPENVATAIARVRPWGVDVSSGVESNGMKDHAKIRAFIAAARAAAS
ncbi:MAG: phosphoribosylanthranilate isomerase [Roseiflexus sp.]|nr:phosphoribosylanthranilate isomerase [Roseiflexus sp.]MCS7287893.1 phosphoribosylanthranilate isomerase [Roseiflexus sp.]MDW8144865.1 phosphoribosylanthranilate isomerase [Roseiflexaceae bacterium]MDW8233036.1 phosphoribosylanthranilate isomerase [Roseiflexaceae bacterium]